MAFFYCENITTSKNYFIKDKITNEHFLLLYYVKTTYKIRILFIK